MATVLMWMLGARENNIIVDATKDYVSCNFNTSFIHLRYCRRADEEQRLKIKQRLKIMTTV